MNNQPIRAAIVLWIAALFTPAAAQTPVTESKPANLEVASIKESQELQGGALSVQPGGRFVATNVRVRDFVNMAFRSNPGLLSQQIIGLPPWTITTRYNIEARFSGEETQRTVDGTTSGDIVGAYVRSLLNNRFGFRAHLEKREMPVYVMSVAPGGFKPIASTLDCSKPDNWSQCNVTYASGRVAGHHLAWTTLLNQITFATGEPIIDHTGLSGQFDIDLQWNPDALTDAGDTRPSMVSALQELGIRLVGRKAAVDVLVIDHVEQPTPD